MVDIMGPIYGALNAIFNPILAMDPNPANPALTVLIIAFIVSLITTIANKYLVDQDEMNEIQAEMKKFQNELREAQKKGDGKRVAELQAQQSEMMQKQSKMMSSQFKPMIITFVPIILIFFWMRSSAIHDLVIILPQTVYCHFDSGLAFHWPIRIRWKGNNSIWYWLVVMVYDLYFWYESDNKKILRIQTRVLNQPFKHTFINDEIDILYYSILNTLLHNY